MRKVSSVVWEFFERIDNEDSRCVAVVCKLCENQYKFFGNTTNLRSHLMKKHPMQWQFRHGSLDVSELLDGDSTLQSIPATRRRTSSSKDNVRYSLSISKRQNSTSGSPLPSIEIERIEVNTDNETVDLEDQEATLNLVKQLHKETDEEWLEEDCEPIKKKRKILKKIKKEVGSPQHYPSVYFPQPSPQRPRLSHSQSVTHSPVRDEYSVFGEYIANKLRKFKTPRTRGNIQQLITTVLWQAEYGVYDDADSVKRILMHSMQYANTNTEVQPEEHTENDA